MKALLQKLLLQLREAGPGAHFAIASAALVLAGLAGFSFYRSSQPHFSVLFSDLDANEAARMTSALAGEGIRFQLSQPPGPHVLYVDDARFFEAHNAVALAGASSKAPKGIQTGAGGASSVFEGQNERVQKSLKRDWEEMEKQLEALEFVVDANVTSSMPDRSAFRRDKARTVAVTLQIAGGGGLSSAQAQTVAKLVRYRFDVPAENVVIADQNGFSLYDGEEAGRLSSSTDPFEQRARFENDLQDKANSILDQVLGPGRARVTVNSEWQWDQSESIQQIIDKDGAAVVAKEESKKESTGAANNSVGGVVGTSANLLDEFGSPGDGVTPIASAPDPPKTKSSESKVESLVGRETRHLVSTAPTLERLSVSLFLDESLQDQLESLQTSVQAAVGFVEKRDSFSAMVLPFASLPRDEEGKILPPPEVEAPAPPSPMVSVLLERGVEIVAALAFVIVLLRSLRGGSGTKKQADESVQTPGETSTAAAAGSATSAAGEELSEEELERLAVAQVEALVKTDPDRVAEILSRWALEESGLEKVGA